MDTARYVVMGVCGSGKSLIGSRLAHALGVEFAEGDAYHPPENVSRMAAGIPLTDADRQAWLVAIAAQLLDARLHDRGLVVSCSALKRSYRDLLRTADPGLVFVTLTGSRALLTTRLLQRREHFMPPSMLDSQLAILELPSAEEHAWHFDVAQTPESIVEQVLARAHA